MSVAPPIWTSLIPPGTTPIVKPTATPIIMPLIAPQTFTKPQTATVIVNAPAKNPLDDFIAWLKSIMGG